MRRLPIILNLLFALALTNTAFAQPTTTSYQGQLVVDGNLFNGSADFKFAILCNGSIQWANDGTLGAPTEPTGAVTLNVDTGVFSVVLGDQLLGMGAIDATNMTCPTPVLRVWVDTGAGFAQLSDSQLSSSLFALRSDIAQRARGNFIVEEGALLLKDDQDQTTVDLDPQGGEAGAGAGLRMSNADGNTTLQLLAEIASSSNPEIRLYDFLGNETITLRGANGEIEINRIRFPDDSIQVTAALGTGGDSDWVEVGNNIYRLNGNVGIGTDTPTSRLHLRGTGSIELNLEADSDNSGETDHPMLRMSQDGGLISAEIGFDSGSNNFKMRRIAQNDTLQITFGPPNGSNLYVSGDMFIGGTSTRADSFSEVLEIRGKSDSWDIGVENNVAESLSDFFIGLGPTNDSMFKIEHDGDIGIGTANPSAKLDIVGDLEVNGAIRVSAVTRYLAIPAAAFTPESDTTDYTQGGFEVYGNTLSEHYLFVAPVQLPHGAVIKEFRVVLDDTSSQGGANFTAFLLARPHFGGSGTIISNRSTAGAPGSYTQLAETENYTVDNQNNQYIVSIDWDTPSSGNTWALRIRSVRITYEVTQLAP